MVVFTSVNGVKHLWLQLEAAGLDSRALGGRKIAAIGPATAQALADRGIRPDYLPEKYIAESVAEGIIALFGGELAGKRVLLPRAAQAREVLPETLREAGATVDVLPVYEARPASGRREEVLAGLEDGSIRCITFGSSSTVTNFLSLIPAETLRSFPGLKLACIGPVTRKTLEEAGLVCHIMPDDYTIPALAQKLTESL